MAKWKIGLAATIGVGVVMPLLTLHGQSRPAPAKPMALTDLDYIEIKQLVARYPFAVDTGNNNGYDYADLFSADGEFIRPYSKGREQLAALARGGRLGPSNVVHYITNHVIEPTPEGAIGREYLFELTFGQAGRGQNGDGQRGQAAPGAGAPNPAMPAPAAPAPTAPAPALDGAAAPPARGAGQGGTVNQWDMIGRRNGELARTGGHYEDVYVKTTDGWRFKRRDFIPSKRGANPTPLAPPRIPADADKGVEPGPLPPAQFIAPTRQSALTALDYIEIGQLVASYGHALDSGYGQGENGEPYASLYTPDAEFAGASGHDQLMALARAQPRGPAYVRHYLTNHVIEPAADGARGKQYLVVFDINEKGEPGSIYLGGHYEDTYAKTRDGWRFKTRRLFPARPATPPAPAPAPAGR
ncbi:MAG: nuclear transport factor 2 family protein [Acidobacteriota bacterium]